MCQFPESVAERFTESLAKGDIDEAKTYATGATGQMLDFAATVGVVPVDTGFSFILVSSEVEGDHATVVYKGSPDGPQEKLELVRIDGEWMVHMQHRK
ncbi:hypothetical protein [Prosthecochloris sp. HL-130-GSB]|uniref:hypothetical protein n=1 Tax=Prosthecochloris sp. HL-130-GSB TaxID=1974213 RepID=UPI001E4B0A50|nr:hypothetical protein [Prosthecochloris sp. HL-130-GSB]